MLLKLSSYGLEGSVRQRRRPLWVFSEAVFVRQGAAATLLRKS